MACSILLTILFISPILAQESQLLALQDQQGRMIWSDGGQFDKQIRVYEPVLPNTDWRMVGQTLQRNYNNLETPIYRFRENVRAGPEKNLERPMGFNWVWDDRLSWADDDVSAWRVSCTDGYIAVSDVFYDKNRINNPVQLFERFGCVKFSLTEKCAIGDKLWDDSGSGASYDIGVWSVKASADQLAGGFFANSKQNDPPTIQPYCMKKNAYIVI